MTVCVVFQILAEIQQESSVLDLNSFWNAVKTSFARERRARDKLLEEVARQVMSDEDYDLDEDAVQRIKAELALELAKESEKQREADHVLEEEDVEEASGATAEGGSRQKRKKKRKDRGGKSRA